MNSIINQNLGVGDNSMKPLSFHWKALFRDGSFISQFENEKENKFQLVRDKFNELQFFYLYNRNNSKEKFIVDLDNGFIFKNEINNYPQEFEKRENIRLIFFRRHRVEMTEKMIEKSHTIEYHLGFQYNDKLGNNQKIILIIDEQGNWILGE